jgi:hypothetical protein
MYVCPVLRDDTPLHRRGNCLTFPEEPIARLFPFPFPTMVLPPRRRLVYSTRVGLGYMDGWMEGGRWQELPPRGGEG